MLHIHQTYTKGGPYQPEVLDGHTGAALPNGAALAIPAGQDRTLLLVRFSPTDADADEGALGSIALHCVHAGMLLKAELSYSAKPARSQPLPKPGLGGARKGSAPGSLSSSCRLAPGPVRTTSLRAPLPTTKPTPGASKPGCAAAPAPTVAQDCSSRRGSAHGELRSEGGGGARGALTGASHAAGGAGGRVETAGRAVGDDEDDVLPDCSRARDQGPQPPQAAGGAAAHGGTKPRATKQLFPPPQGLQGMQPDPPLEGLPARPIGDAAAPTLPQGLHGDSAAATAHAASAATAAAATMPPPAARLGAAPRPPRMPYQPRSSLHLSSSGSVPHPRQAAAASALGLVPIASTPKRLCTSAAPSVQSSPQRLSPGRSLSGSGMLSSHQPASGVCVYMCMCVCVISLPCMHSWESCMLSSHQLASGVCVYVCMCVCVLSACLACTPGNRACPAATNWPQVCVCVFSACLACTPGNRACPAAVLMRVQWPTQTCHCSTGCIAARTHPPLATPHATFASLCVPHLPAATWCTPPHPLVHMPALSPLYASLPLVASTSPASLTICINPPCPLSLWVQACPTQPARSMGVVARPPRPPVAAARPRKLACPAPQAAPTWSGTPSESHPCGSSNCVHVATHTRARTHTLAHTRMRRNAASMWARTHAPMQVRMHVVCCCTHLQRHTQRAMGGCRAAPAALPVLPPFAGLPWLLVLRSVLRLVCMNTPSSQSGGLYV